MLRLDFNLVLTMINLVVLYLILRKFLFRPLMNIMEQRRTMIADGLQHAEDTKKEAYALKSQYESALGGAKEESTGSSVRQRKMQKQNTTVFWMRQIRQQANS